MAGVRTYRGRTPEECSARAPTASYPHQRNCQPHQIAVDKGANAARFPRQGTRSQRSVEAPPHTFEIRFDRKAPTSQAEFRRLELECRAGRCWRHPCALLLRSGVMLLNICSHSTSLTSAG